MEKVRIACIVLSLGISIQAQAQEKSVIRKGLLSVQATLSPAYMFAGKESYFYLHGGIEGFVSDKVSLTGEGFYHLGSGADVDLYDFNHSVFFGASRHFSKNNHDLYVGLQPGIAFTRLNAAASHTTAAHTGINPMVSPVVGYSFYLNNFFHFFVQTRFVFGQHNTDVHQDMTEFRFSAGLGFNLNAMK